MSIRTLPLLLAAALGALPAMAQDGSWLQGGTTPGTAPPAEANLYGLRPGDQLAVAYHHPFGAAAREAMARARRSEAHPGQVYMVRTGPGPAGPSENSAWVSNRAREVLALDFRWVAPPTVGGAPYTPLMGIARFEGAEARPLPAWLEAAPVEGAEVRLCLIGLPEAGAESWEASLFVSETMEPEAALRRAAGLYRYGLGAWGERRGRIHREELTSRWPDAMGALAAHPIPDPGLLLALRVLWRSGDHEIPGPGGIMLKAVDPRGAHLRLQQLYQSE